MSNPHSLERWQVIGQQAAASLAAQRRTFLFWKRARSQDTRALQDFIDLVYNTDPADFTEQQFIRAEEILNRVIGLVELHMTNHAAEADFGFFGEAIRQLREARSWIIQGYSPRADRRPSEAERDQLTADCVGALAALHSSK